jgi:hypothetical protein
MTDTGPGTSRSVHPAPIQAISGAIKPSRHRVRVLTEVINDKDEIALITAAFQSMGWIVRPARNNEARGYPAKNRSWLVVEVHFNGYPRTAPKVAVERIDEVIDKFQLGVWVRYAEIIRFSQAPERTYYIEKMPPGWLANRRLVLHEMENVGIVPITGLVRLPVDTETDVRTALARYDFGKPFDPSQNLIRPAVPDSPEKVDKVTAFKVLPSPVRLPVVVAALTLALLFGAVSIWVPGAWKAIFALLGIAMTIPIALSEPGRTLIRRSYTGFVLAAVVTLAGAILAYELPDHKSSTFLKLMGIAAALTLIGRGVFLALVDSGLTKHISWLFPLVVTALVPFVLALGGTFDTEYLTYGFGIPTNTISVPTILRLEVAGKSLIVGFVVVLLILAIIGWVRYFHGFDSFTRLPMLITAIVAAAFYLLVSISAGLSWVDGAAYNAAAQARAGRQPPAYFGLQGVLECVQPVSSLIPVYNGPLPTHRPVLSFGTTSIELWVWNPGSAQAIGVPLQDVVVTPATGTPAHCK